MRAYEFISEVGIGRGRKFRGSPCTKDCSGHAAGYMWAAKNKIKDANVCPPGGSKSFNKGCQIHGNETAK